MGSKRNGEIDFLRFVFAVLLVIFHFSSSFEFGVFGNGYIAVEFFFVVSGYLMAAGVARNNPDCRDLSLIADRTWQYLLKKTKTFFAYYVSVVLLQIVVRFLLVNHMSVAEVGYRILHGIPTFTLTFMALEKGSLYVSNTWYLSAMLISAFLLYPLLLRKYRFTVEIIFPFLALFLLGYLHAENTSLESWSDWMGFAYSGVVRGVAEMALGGSLYRLGDTEAIRGSAFLHSEKLPVKCFVTLLKFACYGVVLLFAYGSVLGQSLSQSFGLHALLFCAIGILLSFSEAGFCVPDSKVTRYLGKISLPVFIYHGFIRRTLQEAIGHPVSAGLFVLLIILGIVASVALMACTDFIVAKLKARTAKG